mgnify:CR=1 FL=1
MKDNIILDKSFEFAVYSVEIYKFLTQSKKEFVLSKQLLRSGTSIGANIQEAIAAQSRKDFISKMSIASKECRESLYWIKLLIKTGYLQDNDYYQKCEELVRILTSIIKTSSDQ